MVIDPATTKYLIKAHIKADGIIEKSDVVGAIFGQTEGLLGDELDLRELQRSGRIGRIEVEMKSKKDLFEDALSSTRAAVEEGIIPGGGVAYLRSIEKLIKFKGANEDENTGIAIVRRALEEPLRQIVENAGLEGSVVVRAIMDGKGDYGYNAHTEKFENLFEAGVIDPTKVARIALENAASISGMLLTTECAIVDVPEPEPPMPAGGPGGGMGMM